MCPYCQSHDHQPCTVEEKPNGRLVCSCGRHAWPNSGAFLESCRRQSLKVVGQVHIYTQSY